MSEIDFSGFDALTFDCYGTLIDWERGILNALQPVLAPQAIETGEEELLERYARTRSRARGRRVPRLPRDPRALVRGLCADLGFTPTDEDVGEFSESVGVWPAFPDSAGGAAAAGRALQARRHHQLRRRPLRPLQQAPRRGLRLGRQRPDGP